MTCIYFSADRSFITRGTVSYVQELWRAVLCQLIDAERWGRVPTLCVGTRKKSGNEDLCLKFTNKVIIIYLCMPSRERSFRLEAVVLQHRDWGRPTACCGCSRAKWERCGRWL